MAWHNLTSFAPGAADQMRCLVAPTHSDDLLIGLILVPPRALVRHFKLSRGWTRRDLH
jgi:hypothetical protein